MLSYALTAHVLAHNEEHDLAVIGVAVLLRLLDHLPVGFLGVEHVLQRLMSRLVEEERSHDLHDAAMMLVDSLAGLLCIDSSQNGTDHFTIAYSHFGGGRACQTVFEIYLGKFRLQILIHLWILLVPRLAQHLRQRGVIGALQRPVTDRIIHNPKCIPTAACGRQLQPIGVCAVTGDPCLPPQVPLYA